MTLPTTPPPPPRDRVRVLHLAQDGDTSGYFRQLGRFHDRDRYAMTFATLGTMTPALRRSLDASGVTAVSVGADARRAYPLAFSRIVRVLRGLQVDVLHTHLFDPSVVGLLAGAVACVPIRVMTRHYSDYHTRIGKRWHTRLDRLCTRLAHRVIAISHDTARVMRDEEHAPENKIVVVHNGIDLARVARPVDAELAALRRELDLEDKAVISVVARLHPEKGQEHLFRAMPAIVARSPRPPCLLVAGTGSFRSAYQAEVERLGVADAVRFLGFREDATRILAASDVVVLPSVAEGFGLVAAEAMALGCAVVATRVGGIPEVVEDGVSGILVPPASPDHLADAVLALLKDPDRRRDLGIAGRSRVEKYFRFATMMRRYEALYEDLRPGASRRSG